MADVGDHAPRMPRSCSSNLVWHLKAGAGRRLSRDEVRAAMLIRANSHLRGASGIGLELVRRLEVFLNADVTPHVREFGSIGASGDLVPLASITGALIGLDPSFRVDFAGEDDGRPDRAGPSRAPAPAARAQGGAGDGQRTRP